MWCAPTEKVTTYLSILMGGACTLVASEVRLPILEDMIFSPSGPSKALKLGAKGKEVDNFVDKLKSEGENIISSNMGKRTSEATKVHAPPINMER